MTTKADLSLETPLDGHILTSTQYLYNLFAIKATAENVRTLYFKLEAIKTLPSAKIKPEIDNLLSSIISKHELITYETLREQELIFRKLVEELKSHGLLNSLVRHFEITGTAKLKDFLAICDLAEKHQLEIADAQMNNEKTEIFVKLIKNTTVSQK